MECSVSEIYIVSTPSWNTMIYNVYILYSNKLNRLYVGFSIDLEHRLAEHNTGESTYTSGGIPWTLLWSCQKPSKPEAEILERKLKNLTRIRKIKFMRKYADGIRDNTLLIEIEKQ
jgi:putative endonuclease